jgi:hypothetical protein
MISNIVQTGKSGRSSSPQWPDDQNSWFYTALVIAAVVSHLPGLREHTMFGHSLPPLVLVRGLLFTSWSLPPMIQTVLVRKRSLELHGHLGVAGGLLAVTMDTGLG